MSDGKSVDRNTPAKTNSADTKTKILEVASGLFAEKGFNGTSIRDIANAANVNVAAINYHFSNKQTLYWTVTLESHQWLETQIERQYNNSESVEELCLGIYDFLVENSHFVKNAYMMFLSGSVPEIDENLAKEMRDQKEVGPPGGHFIFNRIRQELSNGEAGLDANDVRTCSDHSIKWAVKNIFSCLIHTALMISTNHCQVLYKDHPDFQPHAFRKNMIHNIRSTLAYLKDKRNGID